MESSLVLSCLHVYHPVLHVNYYMCHTLSPYKLRFRRSMVDYFVFLPSFDGNLVYSNTVIERKFNGSI